MNTFGIEKFRAQAERFISAHMSRRGEDDCFRWGTGSDRVSILGGRTAEEDREELVRARRWVAAKFDAGYGWIQGPREYGGRSLSAEYETAFREVESAYETPDQVYFNLGRGSVGPAILSHGTANLREAFLRRLYRGELVACQLFSEPSAGSDLAAVSTRALQSDDQWVLTGQKVWTSGAHLSDVGLILARTDSNGDRHTGLTAFLIDMTAPGVTVAPLRQMSGAAHFSVVYLDEAQVPDSRRVGPVGDGWSVARTALLNERAALGASSVNAPLGHIPIERLVALVKFLGTDDDPAVRRLVAEVHMLSRVADATTSKMLSMVPLGSPPGPEMSVTKLLRSELIQRLSDLLVETLELSLVVDNGEWGTFAWGEYVLEAPGVRIGGGTDNIQHNILAERVLGLPRNAVGS